MTLRHEFAKAVLLGVVERAFQNAGLADRLAMDAADQFFELYEQYLEEVLESLLKEPRDG